MAAEGELLTPGGMFGDFKVVRELGEGGMGAVYLVEDAEGAQFAVKIVNPELAKKDPEFVVRFIREGNFAKDVVHPNLITVYDMGQDPETGYCYLVMDYLPGGDVRKRLSEHGRFPVDEAVRIIAQVANALVVAHARGVVHRDIKPGNIMFDAEGVPHLADLGVAKFEDSESSALTSSGLMIGTPAYMAPEQIMDSHAVDARADVYSLGVVLFEMLAGKRPNEGDSVMGIVAKAVKGEPIPDVRQFRPEVPATIAQLLNLMCAPKREDRIESAEEVVKIFTRYFNRAHAPGGSRSVATASSGEPTPLRTRSRVRRPDGSDGDAPHSRLSPVRAFFTRWKIPLLSAAAAILGVAIFAAVNVFDYGKPAGPQDPTPPPEITPLSPTPAPAVTNAPPIPPTPGPALTNAPPIPPQPAPALTNAPSIPPTPAPVVTNTPSIPPTPAPVVTNAPSGNQLSPAARKALAATGPKLYMVVDLSGGKDALRYPVSYLDRAPAGGWTDEYKTTKLVLRRIEAGTFQMGPPDKSHKVTLTHPYYIGVFEVTQKQYELVMGENPSGRKAEMYPVCRVSYNMVRGENLGQRWPTTDEVDAGSFFGKIRSKVKLKFDLPTEAQWEYACRGGVADGSDGDVGSMAWFRENCDGFVQKVGLKAPNGLGLYDMHGNAWEWCCDRWIEPPEKAVVDPRGGERHIGELLIRGGSIKDGRDLLISYERSQRHNPTFVGSNVGMRIAYTLEQESPNAKLKAGATRSVTLPGGAKYEMVWCPPCPEGFMMGSPDSEKGRNADERRHRVRLTRGFWIGKYELTQAQWMSVMGNNPSKSRNDGKLPVERVTLNECRHFLLKTGSVLRLPTEAEWEYACRSGSAWGIRDMQGKVAEWVADFYAEYPKEEFNPTGTHFATNRVARGGRGNSSPGACRPAARMALGPDTRNANVGVRLAMDESMQDVAGASTLLVMATQGGKKLSNAKLWLGARQVNLPYVVKGLNRGMFVEPYVVSATVNGNHYEGNVPPMPVDWTGVRTNVVELVLVKDKLQQRAGKAIPLVLKNDAAPLEFVYCPPGKFIMHADDQCPYDRHEVTLTYPFFMMKYKLTRAQLSQVKVHHPRTDDDFLNTPQIQMVGGDQMPAVRIWRSAMLEYCDMLTKRYSGSLPTGYVIRLPTLAEWEYAFRAGTQDANDPYCVNSKAAKTVRADTCFTHDEHKCLCAMWNCPATRPSPNMVGLKMANCWGLHDIATCSEGVLDQLPFATHNIDSTTAAGKTDINRFLNYGIKERDPLRVHKSGLGIVPSLNWMDVWWDNIWKDDRWWNDEWWRFHCYRLVIAPSPAKLNRIETKMSYPEIENRKAGTTKTVTLPGGAKLELVWCPPCPNGFMMGSPLDEPGRRDNETQHLVKLTRGFWIGKCEVSQKQWKSVMGVNPSHFKGDNLPVEYVRWDECDAFCRKVGWLRLPTEAEWEYACRAGATGAHAGNINEMAWTSENSGGSVHQVGTQKKANLWGIHDMHGNVWEWCQDWAGGKDDHEVTDPTGPLTPIKGTVKRVNRGGAWDYARQFSRSAYRGWYDPAIPYYTIGFRVVCTAELVE